MLSAPKRCHAPANPKVVVHSSQNRFESRKLRQTLRKRPPSNDTFRKELDACSDTRFVGAIPDVVEKVAVPIMGSWAMTFLQDISVAGIRGRRPIERSFSR